MKERKKSDESGAKNNRHIRRDGDGEKHVFFPLVFM